MIPRMDSIAVITLNWNDPDGTANVVEQARKFGYPNFFIIVVDNGSHTRAFHRLVETAHRLRWDALVEQGAESCGTPRLHAYGEARNGRIAILRLRDNLGFAGGCNVAIDYAIGTGCASVLLLNNDVLFDSETLSQMAKVAQERSAAIVGAVIMDSSGREILFSRRSWPRRLIGLTKSPVLQTAGGSWTSCDVDGCAVLIETEFLKLRHGSDGYYFDPELFMYWEDTDLCLFSWSVGRPCWVAPDAVVRHEVAASSGGVFNARSYYYTTRNRVIIANRWLWWPLRPLFHFYYVLSRLVLQLLHAVRGRPAAARAIAYGILDGYLGRMGRWSHHGS